MTQLPLHPSGLIERVFVRVLSALLWRANAIAPHQDDYEKHAFYRIKDAILLRYADIETKRTMDVQRIVHECRGCYGSGVWMRNSHRADVCNRCNGTGVYKTEYFGLARYSLAGRVFHRPVRRWTELPPDTAVTIEGRVRHSVHGRGGWESMLWLALLFDRRLFRRLLCRADAPRRWTWMPLTNVHQTWQAWASRWRWIMRAFRDHYRIIPSRCPHCGGWEWSHQCEDCIPF